MGSLWNRSGTVERFADDIRAAGAKAYFFQGGTTTPFTVFRDSGESSAFSHPLVADADGRWPDVFVPYTTAFDVRVTTAGDVQLTYSLSIPNPNPVDVSVIVPSEETVQTGMTHFEFVQATKSGYVRLNGRTLGNAASGATERANADASALFIYLWNNMTNALAPVSTGRGGSGASDFAANKTITLPDCRGAAMIGLDDMGNSAAGQFAGLTFAAGDAVTPGSLVGGNSTTLTVGNMPAHAHTGNTSTDGFHSHTTNASGTTSGQSVDHTHNYSGTTGGESATHVHTYSQPAAVSVQVAPSAGVFVPQGPSGGSTDPEVTDHSHNYSGTSSGVSVNHTHTFTGFGGTSTDGSHSHTFTTNSQGSGTAFPNLGLSRLGTWFIKL